MTPEQAENAITLSALVVGGMFAYRKAVEPGVAPLRHAAGEHTLSLNVVTDYKSMFGAAPPIEWAQWLKAAGVLYIATAIIGTASPDIGGMIAILISTSAVIGNGVAVMNDLKREAGTSSKPAPEVLPGGAVPASPAQINNLNPAFGPAPGIGTPIAPVGIAK